MNKSYYSGNIQDYDTYYKTNRLINISYNYKYYLSLPYSQFYYNNINKKHLLSKKYIHFYR